MVRRVLPLLLLLAVLLQAWLRPLQPGSHDPLRLLAGGDGPLPATLRGQLLADPSPHGADGCRVLLQTAGGRSDLLFRPCPALRQGWTVRVSGQLRRPRPSAHPLLAGPAERLARQGSWTRMAVERTEVLARPPTPIVDLRRRMAERFLEGAGPERGGLLAALVLGSAVVPLPAELKADFRASGLSLLGVSNDHVEADRRKTRQGHTLSPLLLVRDPLRGRVIIADRYLCLCAVYPFDGEAVIPGKIV